jgi:hypothetical protein
MTQRKPDNPGKAIKNQEPQQPGRAQHGTRSEVNWEGGSGRHPYGNQDDEEALPPAAAHEAPEGDRGDRSGRNMEQLEQARRKP